MFLDSDPEPEVGFLVFLCRCVFKRMSFNLRPGLGMPSLFSLILLYVSQHRSLIATSSHSLVFTRDARNKDRELRSEKSVLYLNNRSHTQNLRATPGQAEHIAKVFYKIWPMYTFLHQKRPRHGRGAQTDKRLLWNPLTGHSKDASIFTLSFTHCMFFLFLSEALYCIFLKLKLAAFFIVTDPCILTEVRLVLLLSGSLGWLVLWLQLS